MTATAARRCQALALAGALAAGATLAACSGDDDSASDAPSTLSAPRGARDTAAFVNDAVAGKHGEPGELDVATLRLYAEVAADRLPDFAGEDVAHDDARPSADGVAIVVGSVPASRFVALAMTTEAGRERVGEAHLASALDLAVAGLVQRRPGGGDDWPTRLGKLDALVAAARVGGDPPAGDGNEVVAEARDAEKRTIAAAYLVAALRAEAEGTLDPTSSTIIDVAEATMPADALDEVRRRVAEAGDADRAAADLAPALAPGGNDSLAGAFDDLREGFAGHEEYPVQATTFAAFDAHARHLAAAIGRPAGG